MQMKIDKETYKLGNKNFIKKETFKERIVLGNSFATDMNHFIGWNERWFGQYTKTANYTIKFNGDIVEHFSPKYYSNFLNDDFINRTTISIILENEGWLLNDLFENNKYVNYVGEIYKRDKPVIDKKWRNYRFWAPYTDEQVESTVELVTYLCGEYDIPLKVIGHNTNFSESNLFNGILYKSNFERYYTDINPAWNFTEFKKKVENKKG